MKKRILSILLCLCVVIGLLPTVAQAAGNTITPASNTLEALRDAFNRAQNGDTIQLAEDITTSADMLPYISLNKAVTLEFNGHTIHYSAVGTGINGRSGLFYLASGGSLTLKGSGGVTLTGDYSALAQVNAGGKLIIESGIYTNTGATDGGLVTTYGGAVDIKGGTLNTKSYYSLALTNGTADISGGEVSSDDTFALVSLGTPVTISGGTVSSNGSGTAYVASGGSVNMTGGKIENTGSGVALNLQEGTKASTISGGQVSAAGGFGIASFDELTIADGATIRADSGVGLRSDGTLTVTGGSIASDSGIALVNGGSLTMTGGAVNSNSSYGLLNMAPLGKSAAVSGGSITSGAGIVAVNYADGALNISGGSVTTTDGTCAVYNNAAGTVNITGGTLSAKTATIVNNGAGAVKFSAGTIDSIANFNASGSVVIDGGSVKTIQGATPKNSAGTALRQYPIQITGKQNAPIADGELTFTPAVTYSFSGVTTDASGAVYLWLPANETSAVYKTGTENALNGGLAGAGKMTTLPNFVATVTRYLDNEIWANNPQLILLSESPTSDYTFGPQGSILPDGGAATNDVFTFSGLDESKFYYIWARDIVGYTCIGTASADVLTKDNLSARVDYYTVTLANGEGIASTYIPFNPLRKGADMDIFATLENGYSFKHWLYTGTNDVFSAAKDATVKNISAPLKLTAVGELNVYDATVTVNKDNAAWTDTGKTITLSTSAENKEANKQTGAAAGATVSFTALDPRETYYVWADGNYTGQTITNNTTAATLDYYTVTVAAGANIASVTINNSGNSLTVLKGGSATIAATATAGDYVFSRWNEGGALYSTTVETVISNITAPISLTAVGGATKYTAAVTLKKDGADWTSSPRKIVLSTSASELAGTVIGTVSDNTYTFANLPGTGNYFVWDADTVTYTGKEINSTVKSAALDYYTVKVDKGENVTAVTGAGEYLEGSNVTVTATLSDYCRIVTTGWTGNSLTIISITKAETITVAAVLDTYNGTVTVNKDGASWSNYGKNVTLSTDKNNKETGKLEVTGVSGKYSFANLDPRIAYYIWADGVYTGRVLSRAATSATVDYYSVSVTKTNASVTSEGVYLAGSSVTLTATPSNGFDFVGWYSGSTPLSGNTTYTIDNLSSKQELTAMASNTFSATVIVSGVAKPITLVKDGDAPILPDSGTTGTFSNLTRGITYSVYADGVDTGKTVSKDAPSIVLSFFTVNLSVGPGISNVTGGGTYLAGSPVPISAEIVSGYTFNGWRGTASFTDLSSTISNIDKDYSLTASAYKKYDGGSINISNGSITISNSDTAEKIKVVQNGAVIADGIDPSQAITITGTSGAVTKGEWYQPTGGTSGNSINMGAERGATIILEKLHIEVFGEANTAAIDITSTAGNVTLILKDSNTLYSGNTSASSAHGSVALRKSGTNALTIQSIDGTVNHSLTATGAGICSTGIGTYYTGNAVVSNITINSGTVTTSGSGAGIGVYHDTTSGITVNGGIVTTNIIGSYLEYRGMLSDFTVYGGTLTVGQHIGAIYNGNIIFKGGSLNVANVRVPPTNDGSIPVKKVTVTTGFQKTDVSGKLTITKQDDNSFSYGTKDMWTTDDANGDIFLWLPNGTYTATLGTVSKTFTVPASDSVSLKPTYDVNMPASVTTEGVTASATASNTSGISPGAPVTVTVTISGTALKPGTYTVGLTGTGIGTVATQTFDVTKDQSVNTNKIFTFTMPASNVSDLAATLSFTEKPKHTVSFKDGEALISSASYYEGESYPLLDGSALKKTGYAFGGWGVTGGQTMGNADVTLTAQWTANTYTVTFHNGGGTGSMSAQQFTHGAAQALTSNGFTRDGYTFAGWAATSGGAKLYHDGAGASITANTNLYALWTPKTYTVSFDANGGTGTMEQQSFAHGTAQELTPNAFTRTGYTFAGWKDTSNAPYQNGASYTAAGNMTLTAQWAPISYTVKFSANGGTGSIGNQSFAYDAAQNLTANTMTRTGYTFDGWAESAGGVKKYDSSASVSNLTAVNGATVTLYAVWTPNTYTMKFDKNSTEATGTIDDQPLPYDTAANLTKNTAILRKGYTFAGWNTATGGTGTTYADQASVKNLTADKDGAITLYAQWSAEVYALTFSANGGTGSMNVKQFASNSTETIGGCDFTKAGYTFTGWNSKADGTGTSYAADAGLNTLEGIQNKTTTLFARWTANTYAVTFHANGGVGSIGNQSFTYDAAQTLTANTMTRTGYKFVGWSDAPMATTATYQNNQSVSNLTTMKDGSVTLYAVWQSDTYSVSFVANGGAGRMADLSMTNGESKTLSMNEFTREGYKFSGWNTQPDGKGPGYADGATVSFTPDATGMVTLYAMWTESARYNISGTVNDDATPTPGAVSGAAVTLKKGGTVTASTKTNASGAYSMTNILPGLYNLVITKDDKTVTKLVTVAQADVTANITLPDTKTTNSVLVVDGEVGEAMPNVVVGGLDTLSQTENADITMTVTAKAEDEANAQQTAIKTAAGSQTLAQFLDITLKKGAADIGDTNSTVLEIVQSFSFGGKADVTVWRYHGSAAEKLKKLETKPTAPFEDGTYFADSQNGLIYVYAKKFSTYAVSYQEVLPSSGGGAASYSVTVNASESGTVKADKTTAALGTKVTITVTPNTGYMMKSLSVTDTNGKSIAHTDNRNGTFTFTMPNSNVTVSAKFAKQSGNPFIDVADHAYYYDAILWAVEKGVTNGTSATTFSPNMTCTRAQTVTFLWRAMGSPEPTATKCPFTDVVTDAYYYKAVLWATEKGITVGTSATKFSPDMTVTRSQTVTLLWRMAGKSTAIKANPFTDVKSTAYYADAVLWAVEKGITKGTSAATFSPVDGCPRAQIVTFLYRYLSK